MDRRARAVGERSLPQCAEFVELPGCRTGTEHAGHDPVLHGCGTRALIDHSDQYRGISYSLGTPAAGPGGTQYAQPSPDYFVYQDLGGPGLVPAGYGVRSVRRIVLEALRVERASSSLDQRRQLIAEIDRAGILATPSNSRYNEAVCEAARKSIRSGGALVEVSLPTG